VLSPSRTADLSECQCGDASAPGHTDMLDMWVIFMDISAGQGGLSSVEMEARRGCCRSMFDSVC
jgi:hypothetical protein